MSSSRKEEMGWNDQDNTSLPPLNEQQRPAHKLIRFREPVAPEARRDSNASVAARRSSKLLPSVHRKNSLVAFEPIVAKFVKNGDKFFEGVQLNISPRFIRNWEVLLAELSTRIDLPAGVRKIYTPENGHRVNSLSELEHHKVYVCASTEPFKRIDYKKVKNPDWKTTKSRPSETVPPSIFSKSQLPLVSVDVNANFKRNSSAAVDDSLVEGNSSSNRFRRISRTRRPSRLMRLSSITEPDSSFLAVANMRTSSSNQPLSPTNCNAKPTAVTIFQNGPPPRYNVLVYLNREAIRSWEEAKKLIKENLPGSNGVLRLYKPDGDEVQSLSQLWRAGSILIATGKEKFNIADFMVGAGAPATATTTLNHLQQASVEKPTGTALPIRGVALNGATEDEDESRHSVPAACVTTVEAAETNTQLRVGKGGRKRRDQCVPRQEDEAKVVTASRDDRVNETVEAAKKEHIDDSANLKERDSSGETVKKEESLERQTQTADQSHVPSLDPAIPRESGVNSDTSEHKDISARLDQKNVSESESIEKDPKTTSSNGAAETSETAAEVHPESEARTKPTVGFSEPQTVSRPVSESITPAISPDEESQGQSTRPKTLSFISEKYAGLLGQGYRPGSTSSSSDLLESPLYAARRRLLNQRGFPNPLVQPQTPQSDISLGVFQSVVDMLLPRPVDFGAHSDMDTAASASSSDSAQQTRNIGIQTQCEDNRLSSVFESEDQQPPSQKSKEPTRLVHASKWMMESQTRLALKSLSLSQSLDTFQSSKQTRDKYSIGMTLGEGNFATVKQCREKSTEREFLLRVINKAKVFGREDLILREVTIMKMLRQENVMQVVDHWETSDDMYLVVENIEGSDLFDAILNCQHFSEADAATAVRQLGMALVYLHANQIVHRDVKPENVFLSLDSAGVWTVKLGGFSLAAVATEPLSQICGNQYYRAPEMVLETGYGTKLDVWAAGVITYLIICGSLPFGRKSRTSLTSNALMGKVSFPSCYWSEISKEAKDFVKHLMKISPSQRYSSSEMLQHPWIKDLYDSGRSQSVEGNKLYDYLISKASVSPKLTSVPVLAVTALDHHPR